MKRESRHHKLNRREALIGLTGFAVATPLLAQQVASEKEQARSLAAKTPVPPPAIVKGRDQLFDQDWRFHRGDIDGAEATGFDDSTWRKLDLPHDWSIEDLTPVSEAWGAARSGWGAMLQLRLAHLM